MFKKQQSSDAFWAWLAANTSRIQRSEPKTSDDFVNELSRAFKKSHPNLTWEITPNNAGDWIFCISADGNSDLFNQVQWAVGAAPHLPGWKIVAFRQRGSLDATIDMNGQELGYDDIWCKVTPDGARVQLILNIRGLTSATAKALLGVSFVLLDNALGEHDAVVKISDMDSCPLPADPVKTDSFFPLSELPGYLDRLEGGQWAARSPA